MNSFYVISVLVLALSAGVTSSHASEESREKKKETVRRIVESYQDEIFHRYGDRTELLFRDRSDAFQMTGGHTREGKLEITVYGGALERFSADGIVMATCHEIGHVLGEVTLGDAGEMTRYDPRDSVEGEADYFGGACARRYFSERATDPAAHAATHTATDQPVPHETRYCAESDAACNRAIAAVRSVMYAMYGSSPDETIALSQKYEEEKGIDSSYPSRECRALSAIQGVLGAPRPACWYNR